MNVVAYGSEIMPIAIINDLRLVAPLEKVSPKLMTSIVSLRERSLKPLHRANKIALRRFQQQVVMIAHQAPSMNNHLIPNTNLPQGSNKQIGILIPSDQGTRPQLVWKDSHKPFIAPCLPRV